MRNLPALTTIIGQEIQNAALETNNLAQKTEQRKYDQQTDPENIESYVIHERSLVLILIYVSLTMHLQVIVFLLFLMSNSRYFGSLCPN